MTDLALIAQVITTGNERAFGQLVERHQEGVRRFLLRLCSGDSMRADDLAQETFIRAWQGLDNFRRLAGFQTWLMIIAYRVFLDDERRALKPLPLPPGPHPLTPSPRSEGRSYDRAGGEWNGDELLRHDIDLALSTLTEAERTCIVLQCIEGHSIRDIASITGLGENTIKSHLLRGKKHLASFLRNNGY